MNVKRFIGKDVTEAMNQVRDELGRDAFILNTRKIKKKGIFGFLKKPLVEVVAAFDAPAPIQKFTRPSPAWVPPPTPEQDVFNHAAQQQTISAMQTSAAPQNGAAQPPVIPPPINGAPTLNALTALTAAVAANGDGYRYIEKQPDESDEKMKALETKLDSLSTTLGNLVSKMQIKGDYRSAFIPEIEHYLLSLLGNEVHEEFAHKIAREVNDIVSKQGEDAGEVFEQILKQHLGEASPVKMKRFKRQVILFVGPTGVGKTTTLAKLAAIYALNHHAKVGIITTDTYRISAVEQLKTYAEILETPISVAYSPEEVSECLKEHEDKDVVFIDTAGRSPKDSQLEGEITRLIKHSQADEIHLVISATTSFSGCVDIINTYSFLRDFKLVFTKLDETSTWGAILNLKFLTDKPISYIAAGQNVPDDIEVANSRKIINRLMEKESNE